MFDVELGELLLGVQFWRHWSVRPISCPPLSIPEVQEQP